MTAPSPAPVPADTVRAGVQAARERWPDVVLPDEAFFAYLEDRIPEDTPPAAYLAAVDLEELWLCCAAGHGDPAAHRHFDAGWLGEVRVGLSRLRPGAELLDEVAQWVRTRLLLPEADRPPALLGYAGRGDLRALIRLMALRRGISLKRQERDVPALDEARWAALPDPATAPDLRVLRRQHRESFQAALAEATDGLTSRQRNLLRLHLIERVTLDALARMYRVDRSTITRWMAAARRDLFRATRSALQAQMGLAPEELDSFLLVLESHLDASVARLLETRGDP